MALKQDTFRLGEEDITIQQMGTSISLKYSVVMGKILGGISQGLLAEGDNFGDWDLDIGKMMSGLMGTLDEESTPKLLKELIQDSLVQPNWSSDWYENKFGGNLDMLAELIQKILEFNFGGLIEHLRKKMTRSDGSSSKKSLKKTV